MNTYPIQDVKSVQRSISGQRRSTSQRRSTVASILVQCSLHAVENGTWNLFGELINALSAGDAKTLVAYLSKTTPVRITRKKETGEYVTGKDKKSALEFDLDRLNSGDWIDFETPKKENQITVEKVIQHAVKMLVKGSDQGNIVVTTAVYDLIRNQVEIGVNAEFSKRLDKVA